MEPARNSTSYPVEARRKTTLLNTPAIILLVVAAAAPLAAIVGNMPIALGLPGALGVPAVFLATIVVLLCFAVGYAAMSREIVSTGAFYTYIGQGLGKTAAIVAAFVALLAYGGLTLGLGAGFGYFASLLLAQLGLTVPWLACSAIGLFVTAVFGFRSIDISAKLLAILITAEFAILAAFDVLVVAQRGAAAFPLEIFAPTNYMTLGIGSAVPFAVASFVGFESAALYGEDSANPVRTVPRATYGSVLVIGLFYFFTLWLMIGAVGPDQVQAIARAEGGNLLFRLTEAFGGPVLTTLTGVFFITSVLASLLALHSATSRYLFAIARDGLLPGWLASYHPDHHSPHVASLLMTGAEFCIIGTLGLIGVNPYVGIASSLFGFGSIGIVILQLGAAFAAFTFMRRKSPNGFGSWLTLLGSIGLAIGLVLMILNYSALTGTDLAVVNYLPAIFPVVIAAAMTFARYLRFRKPMIYKNVARSTARSVTVRTAALVHSYTDRYCVVGAGPSGLIMARALLKEGVPFDCFEKHSDVGGIWDPANTGSPMYESAHFISSKWTSYFYGFPMPDSYPDYPSHKQILAYIRSFAHAFGLYEHIKFNVAVISAVPTGEGWMVELSTGERRSYAGLICAPGTNWTPRLPQLAGIESFKGEVRHSVTYRSTDEMRGRRVLVMGGGNSGVDIACDAARAASTAFLSLRRGYRFVPKHLFGIPTDVLTSGKATPPRGVSIATNASVMLDTINGDMVRLGLPEPDHDALTSHPIMNTQILHYLAHGDIAVKPDVKALDGENVVFADGSLEAVDLILFCTGYEFRLPFMSEDLFVWKHGKPQLYLNVMHREQEGLYVIGFTEFASAAYRNFDDMAQIVVADIHVRATGIGREKMQLRRRFDYADLAGGKTYVDSPRHANYVDIETFWEMMTKFRREFGWPDLNDTSYEMLRKKDVPESAVPSLRLVRRNAA